MKEATMTRKTAVEPSNRLGRLPFMKINTMVVRFEPAAIDHFRRSCGGL